MDEEWQKLSLPCGGAGKTIHTVRSSGRMPGRNKEDLLMKAKTKLYKLLSMLLCCVMLVGLLPMTA
ncbi:MAG: hypothetical protein SO075_07480, partial [Eubacteriales bacterium]|nr:hypothetical protein [Eubacteriales bacterium]